MCWCAQAATEQGASTTEVYFCMVFEAGSPWSRCHQDWCLRTAFSWWQLVSFLSVHTHTCLHTWVSGVSFHKDTNPLGLGAHPYALTSPWFHPQRLQSQTQKLWGLALQLVNCVGTHSVHIRGILLREMAQNHHTRNVLITLDTITIWRWRTGRGPGE